MSRPSTTSVLSIAWKEGPTDPVIREQVVARSHALRELGFDSRVLIGVERPADHPAEGVVLVAAPRFASLVRKVWVAVRPHSGSEPSVLLCRGPTAALAGLLATRLAPRNCAVVYDCRGWYEAESEHRGHGAARKIVKRWLDRFVLDRVDHAVAVSPALLGVLVALGADPAKCSVIPPFTIQPGSSSWTPADGSDVIYIGNSRLSYQSGRLIEPVLRAIAERNPGTTVGWLDSAAGLEPDRLAPNLWRRRVDQDQVAGYLTKARVAVLIREPDRTNTVAFPTKAAQYMAAGCRIVSSQYPPSLPFISEASGRGATVPTLDGSEWATVVAEQLELPRPDPVDLTTTVPQAWARVINQVAGQRD